MRTSFHHQPEAQHPIFQLSTSWQADYPIFRIESRLSRCPLYPQKRTLSDTTGMSALCQSRHNAPQQNVAIFGYGGQAKTWSPDDKFKEANKLPRPKCDGLLEPRTLRKNPGTRPGKVNNRALTLALLTPSKHLTKEKFATFAVRGLFV